MSLCNYCKGESIKDLTICGEAFCRYECYDTKYSLEDEIE
jgi:hypothetical protein